MQNKYKEVKENQKRKEEKVWIKKIIVKKSASSLMRCGSGSWCNEPHK